mgnify:CR=1 FL=1
MGVRGPRVLVISVKATAVKAENPRSTNAEMVYGCADVGLARFAVDVVEVVAGHVHFLECTEVSGACGVRAAWDSGRCPGASS